MALAAPLENPFRPVFRLCSILARSRLLNTSFRWLRGRKKSYWAFSSTLTNTDRTFFSFPLLITLTAKKIDWRAALLFAGRDRKVGPFTIVHRKQKCTTGRSYGPHLGGRHSAAPLRESIVQIRDNGTLSPALLRHGCNFVSTSFPQSGNTNVPPPFAFTVDCRSPVTTLNCRALTLVPTNYGTFVR